VDGGEITHNDNNVTNVEEITNEDIIRDDVIGTCDERKNYSVMQRFHVTVTINTNEGL
jgi:hypothetical protein